MNRTTNSSQTLALWATIVTLAGLAAIMAWQWSGASANWVSHTLIVQQQLTRLLSAAQDLETGQRGYIIAADERFLAPYNSAKADAPRIVGELKRLVGDNSEQLAFVEQIEAKLAERLKLIDARIDEMRAGRVTEARDPQSFAKGAEAMDQLRVIIDGAKQQEQQLFEARQASFQSQRFVLLGSLMAVLLGSAAIAYVALVRERERAAGLEAQASALEGLTKSLEARVAERTNEIAFERDRAEAERERAEALLRDVTHRIGNTLALVVGFINLHIRHASDPLSIKTLTGARSRIHAIASAQRRINVTNDLDLVRIDTLIGSVMSDLVAASGDENIHIKTDVPPLLAPAQSATSLCVLTQEFVMNSLKHAFPDGRKGTISVQLDRSADGGASLTVADDGIGISPTDDAGAGAAGLGGKIATLLTRQFNGAIEYSSTVEGPPATGTTVVVSLPDLKLAVADQADAAPAA